MYTLNAANPTKRTHIIVYQSAHCTVRDSYLYGSTTEDTGAPHYGIEDFGTADTLVENNIIQRRTTPLISDGETGSVFGYNFSINDQYNVAAFMQASNYSHEGGNGMVLHEGNQAVGLKGDIVHGTSNLLTFFRNYSLGWETGKTAETYPAVMYAYQRYWHFIGNVLGTVGYHTVYADTVADARAIYGLGLAGSVIAQDPVVATTLMRWGNYDVVNATVQWNSAEVPSGIANYPNAVPANHNLPPSFYLSARPTWFRSAPWPGIGPDVTTGSDPSGHAANNPAKNCYLNVMNGPPDGTGGPLTFNASACY